MGFRVLMISIRGKNAETIHAEYGVMPTGKYVDFPDSPVSGALMQNGAYLLCINDDITPDEKQLAPLSRDATLIACYVNETVMYSGVYSWANGVEEWSVWHDAQQGLTHVEWSGREPDQLAEIRDRLLAKQIGVTDTDYVFDVPVELFKLHGGIDYAKNIPDSGPDPWQVLVRIKRKSLWWPFGK